MRQLLPLAAVLVAACTTNLAPRPAYRSDPAELVAAERAFMDAAHGRGVEGWVSFFADSGALLPARGPAAVGHAAIRRQMAGAFSDPRLQLRWAPVKASVAASGDLGYTWGTWQLVARDSAGGEQIRGRGKYITAWQRDARGAWKVAVDGGNEEPADGR